MYKGDELIDRALQARKNSFSPYSHFKVGAAVKCDSGNIFIGTNVESSSYGLTVCAERNAIAAALVHGDKRITKICFAAV